MKQENLCSLAIILWTLPLYHLLKYQTESDSPVYFFLLMRSKHCVHQSLLFTCHYPYIIFFTGLCLSLSKQLSSVVPICLNYNHNLVDYNYTAVSHKLDSCEV